jgi:glycosyltransferase involved in cell wall biosynthesis
MKILMVNKFHYIKGGSETYYFALKSLLEKKGHMVIDFSMKDERNFSSSYSDYFIENIDYGRKHGIQKKIHMAKNIIYSREAKIKFEKLVRDTKPDLVHLHIFQHQMSPSILDVIKKYNIPTVYTAHDLKMACLNYKMMHHGKVCEECKGECYLACAKNRCVKDSLAKSMINVIEGYFHKWRRSYDVIDIIVTPSAFYKQKLMEFGIQPERIVHIQNFMNRAKPSVNLSNDSEQYLLYFGRLSEEKGIMTLIKAIEGLQTKLFIVGTGPLQVEISGYLKDYHIDNVEMLGFKSGQELVDLIGNAKAVILPSEWYENGPYTAIEALQLGRVIIGADIGGIPELVNNNGYLFESGSIDDLKKKITALEVITDEEYQDMKQESEKLFESDYTPHQHYERLMLVYEQVLEMHRN